MVRAILVHEWIRDIDQGFSTQNTNAVLVPITKIHKVTSIPSSEEVQFIGANQTMIKSTYQSKLYLGKDDWFYIVESLDQVNKLLTEIE